MSSRGLFPVAIAFASVLLATPDDAAAFCRMTTEGGGNVGNFCVEEGAPLEWNYPCLSYAIDSRGSQWMDFQDVEAAVDLAFETWENADCGGSPPNLIFTPLLPSTCKRAEYNCSGNVNTIAFLNPWKDECSDPEDPGYDRNAFAVTIVWHNTSTGEILDADMMINDQLSSRFNAGGPYTNCPDTGCEDNFADLGSIVTHEAGHFIGIGHCNPIDIDDPEDPCVQATMFAVADRASVNKRTLAEDDIDAVCTIYPPGDLDQSCDWTPKGGLELDCEASPCSDETCTAGGSSGCSATRNANDAPWGGALAALIGLTAWRRRRAAES